MGIVRWSAEARHFHRLCTNRARLETPPNNVILPNGCCNICIHPHLVETVAATTVRSYGGIGASSTTWDMGYPTNAIYNGQRCWGKWDAFEYSEISVADLTLNVSAITGTPVGTYAIYGVKALSHTTPLNYVDIGSLTKTTATVSVNTSGMTAGAVVTKDITAILQEIIAQSGWVAGTNNLGLVAIESGVTNGNYARITPVELQIIGTKP